MLPRMHASPRVTLQMQAHLCIDPDSVWNSRCTGVNKCKADAKFLYLRQIGPYFVANISLICGEILEQNAV